MTTGPCSPGVARTPWLLLEMSRYRVVAGLGYLIRWSQQATVMQQIWIDSLHWRRQVDLMELGAMV